MVLWRMRIGHVCKMPKDQRASGAAANAAELWSRQENMLNKLSRCEQDSYADAIFQKGVHKSSLSSSLCNLHKHMQDHVEQQQRAFGP